MTEPRDSDVSLPDPIHCMVELDLPPNEENDYGYFSDFSGNIQVEGGPHGVGLTTLAVTPLTSTDYPPVKIRLVPCELDALLKQLKP